MRVLIVAFEAQLAEVVARGLRREGMAVDVSLDGPDARRKAALVRYDVVVMDRDHSGLSLDDVGRLHGDEGVSTRVLMLAMPFAFADLVAQLRALGPEANPTPTLRAGDVELNPAGRTVTRKCVSVDLTRKEYAVLETLVAAKGAVISSDDLLERIWDERADPFVTTVRVTMMTLRRKLGEPPIIDTVVGAGYRIDPAVSVDQHLIKTESEAEPELGSTYPFD